MEPVKSHYITPVTEVLPLGVEGLFCISGGFEDYAEEIFDW